MNIISALTDTLYPRSASRVLLVLLSSQSSSCLVLAERCWIRRLTTASSRRRRRRRQNRLEWLLLGERARLWKPALETVQSAGTLDCLLSCARERIG